MKNHYIVKIPNTHIVFKYTSLREALIAIKIIGPKLEYHLTIKKLK